MNQSRHSDATYAHILAAMNEMIEESVYHTETFAYTLKIHHNDNAAAIFTHACKQFRADQAIVMNETVSMELPSIPPWEKPFPNYQHPSSLLMNAHYLMNEAEAREIINSMTMIHQDFYNYLLETQSDSNMIKILKTLIDNERFF